MSLNPTADHPGSRSYVVKLHRDADPAAGALRGRLENLATGRRFEFEDGGGLVAALLADLAQDGGDRRTPGAAATLGGLLLALASAGLLAIDPPGQPAVHAAAATQADVPEAVNASRASGIRSQPLSAGAGASRRCAARRRARRRHGARRSRSRIARRTAAR